MAWERRGNNLYYYQKIRIAGSVVSRYVGKSAIARQIALMDFTARIKRNEDKSSLNRQKEEFGLFNNQVIQMGSLVDLMVENFLIIAGFHKHRGQWRRRRDASRQRAG